MNFNPRTKEELDAMNLLNPGIYHFKVANAKDKISKNGNEMIELTLEVYDNEGNSKNVFDYLLDALPQKLYAFCYSTGMSSLYRMGGFTASQCIDATAYVDIAIQKGGPNPQGGNYADKNVVKKYTTKPINGSKPIEHDQKLKEDVQFDDDVPF